MLKPAQTGQYSAADVEPTGAALTPLKHKPKLKTESQPNCQVAGCSDLAVVTAEYGSRIESRNCFDTELWVQGFVVRIRANQQTT
jgi:hypothetical protein